MSSLSDQEVYQAIEAIVSKHDLFECDDCAKAVLKWLRKNKIERKLLRLKSRYRGSFIVSLRLERVGIGESITQNGVHYGVEVRGRVFDNLSSEGLTRDEWIRDFESRDGEVLVEELEDF